MNRNLTESVEEDASQGLAEFIDARKRLARMK